MLSLTESEISKIVAAEKKSNITKDQSKPINELESVDNLDDGPKPNPRKCDSFI